MKKTELIDMAVPKFLYHTDRTNPSRLDIFVFGSNLAGIHGAGAAFFAAKFRDARAGVGEGFTGRTYAIPTKDERLRTRPLHQIQISVDAFLNAARSNPDVRFFVTRIGCGLAGYKDEEIAPMFRSAPQNCSFAREWMAYLET